MIKPGTQDVDLIARILDALEGCNANCLDNAWEQKLVAARVASRLTGRTIEPQFTPEEAEEAAEHGY